MSRPLGDFRVKFWGTRGSIPTPGPGTVKYGGNTSCLEVRCGKELIILDAGTGIRDLGVELLKETPVRASILFSHVHWDHVQGIPFFQPAYIPGNEFKLYGNKNWDTKLENALKLQMQSPNFPITLDELNAVGAKMEYIDIDFGTIFRLGNSDRIIVRSVELRHPDRAFGFRIEYGGKSLVYAPDTENLPEPGDKILELSHDADVLIHDAQYTHEEYYAPGSESKANWGHSTPEAAARTAAAANVKELILFHHDPYHEDATVDRMLLVASAIFPNVIAASEGMVIGLLPAEMPARSYAEEENMSLSQIRLPHPKVWR